MKPLTVHHLLRLACGLALLVGFEPATAATSVPEGPFTVTSRSGQFMVSGRPASGLPSTARQAELAAANRVEFDPTLAAASCERVRAALNRKLRAEDGWKGKVAVSLIASTRADLKGQITNTRYRNGWQYRLDLLNPTDEETFVRVVTQVLLQEHANREPADRAAELPLWLVAGLARELLATESDLVVRSQVEVNRRSRGATNPGGQPDPVAGPRKLLAQRPALSFDELSWPSDEILGGERRRLFDASAHLFVHQLLKLPDGPAMMRHFLAQMSQHLNWQIAFLRAFGKPFKSLLDVEKWWAVNLAAFTGRSQWHMWSAETALEQFNELLLVRVEVRANARAVPQQSAVKLQTTLQDWDFARQQTALRGVLANLGQARMNVPPELIRLLDDYRGALDNYLSWRGTATAAPLPGQVLRGGNALARPVFGTSPGGGPPVATNFKLLTRDTIRRLDALDADRENLAGAIARAKASAAASR